MRPAPDRRVTDWLDSGVVAISGFVPPGQAATQARGWSAELQRRSAARGHPVYLDGARLLGERAALNGGVGRGAVSVGGACRLLACSDGWVALSLPRPTDVELLAPLIEGPVSDAWRDAGAWMAQRTAAEIVERAGLLGIALSHVGEGATPLELPPLPPLSPERPAGPAGPAGPTGTPLVVDFSALWAGPLCAALLGLAGARVVKVESASRLDGARGGEPRFYDLLHAGHQSVTVDPSAAADRGLLTSLVAAADVVIESSRPRALAGWGLDAAAAVSRGTVWVSITAYGRGHPERVGFGDDAAAGAGLVGWADGVPQFVGDAIADPLTGLVAAVAALRALDAGQGALLDIALASTVVGTLDGTPATPAAGLVAEPPVARPVTGSARSAGADTAALVAEFR